MMRLGRFGRKDFCSIDSWGRVLVLAFVIVILSGCHSEERMRSEKWHGYVFEISKYESGINRERSRNGSMYIGHFIAGLPFELRLGTENGKRLDGMYEIICDREKVDSILVGADRDALVSELYMLASVKRSCGKNEVTERLGEVSPDAASYSNYPLAYILATGDFSEDWKMFVANRERWDRIFARNPLVILAAVEYGRCENVRFILSLGGDVWSRVLAVYPSFPAYYNARCG